MTCDSQWSLCNKSRTIKFYSGTLGLFVFVVISDLRTSGLSSIISINFYHII